MLKKCLILAMVFFLSINLFSQEKSPYQEYLDRAEEYFKKREYSKAIEELNKVLASQDKRELARAYWVLGNCSFEEKDREKAVAHFKKSLTHDPDYLPAIEMLGIIHSDAADLKQKTEWGLKYLLRAEELSSRNHKVFFHLARLYSLSNDLEKACLNLERSFYYGFEDFESMKTDPDLANVRRTAFYSRLVNGADKLKKAKEYLKSAEQAFEKVDYSAAITNYELCRNNVLSVFGEEGFWIGALHNDMGKAYAQKGEFDKAIGSYEKALAGWSKLLGEGNANTAELYNNLGVSHSKKGDYDKAVGFYEKAAAILTTLLGEYSESLATCFGNLGAVYSYKAKYREALDFLKKALAIQVKIVGENHISTVQTWNNIGRLYVFLGEYEEARRHVEKALEINKKIMGEDHPDTAVSYDGLGVICRYKGEYDRAISYYEKALAIRLKALGGDHLDLAATYNNLGIVYFAQGDYEKALEGYGKALPLVKKYLGEKHPNTATCYDNVGSVYLSKGEYDKALMYYEKALAIYLEIMGENHPATATSYNNIGSVYSNRGEEEKAIVYHEKALVIRLKVLGENHPATANSYNNLGISYRKNGNHDKAIEYHEKALAIRIRVYGVKHPETAASLNNLGYIFDEKKDYIKAIVYYEKVLEIRLAVLGENHPETAAGYNNLGSAHKSNGSHQKAIECYEKALRIMKKTGARQEAITIADNLGLLHLRLKNYPKAKAAWEEAIAIIERARGEVGSGRVEFMARNIDSYLYSLKTSALMKDTAGVFSVSEAIRARGFLDRLSLSAALSVEGVSPDDRRKMTACNDELESLARQREHELKKEIAQQNKARLAALGDAIFSKEKEFQALDEKLMHNERYRDLRRPQLADLAAAQKLCGPGGAILEYVVWEHSYENSYCIVITEKGAWVVELDRDFDYSGAVEKMREAVQGSVDSPKKVDEPAAALYAKLIAPLEQHLSGISRLMIVPDGPLAFLPFDALKKEANGRYLCEKFSISLAPSVSVLLQVRGRKRAAAANALIAFGGAVYSKEGGGVDRGKLKGRQERGLSVIEKEKQARAAVTEGLGKYYEAQGYAWENLPGTLTEVKKITGEVYGNQGTMLLTGKDVTEQQVKALSRRGELGKYGVIHFACHGYYEQSYPSFSSIILSEVSKAVQSAEDGYLNVEEAALLNLNCALVNLSACETGLGKIVQGDGVIGLTRALLVAGSAGVGVTLWSVADEATCEFMIKMYTRVVKGKMSFAAAYHETKLEFIKSGRYNSPYFWSPFILYGE